MQYSSTPVPITEIALKTADATALTAAMATIANSWWILDPSKWANPTGRLYRIRAYANGMTGGDQFQAQMYSDTDSAALLVTPVGAAAAAGPISFGACEVISAWQAFPATTKMGFVQAVNLTAARGTFLNATLEVM